MSALDPCIFQSITKTITHFYLKYLHRFIIKYDRVTGGVKIWWYHN